MSHAPGNPVVHLELLTGNLPRACAFYTRLFGWQAESIHLGAASYLTLALGDRIQGGVVESATVRPRWLPYVEVPDVYAASARALVLGGTVVLGPREGPAGWRCVVASPDAGEIALWQPKS